MSWHGRKNVGLSKAICWPITCTCCIEIPPKYSVASVIGFIKGKSAIAIARQFSGRERNFSGEHFWARRYAVSTVGFELEEVKKYIQEQEHLDADGRF